MVIGALEVAEDRFDADRVEVVAVIGVADQAADVVALGGEAFAEERLPWLRLAPETAEAPGKD